METTTIRTQVLLDKEILEQALQITHLKSKRELLDYALRDTSATKNKKSY
jgi:Arc/MetJ family transcription regulator